MRQNAPEQAAEEACVNLGLIIEAAMNSNQAGENAAVMADAAPALYNALVAMWGAFGLNRPSEELITDFGNLGISAIRLADAAIAKAEGRATPQRMEG